jgi:hypothetical protein
MAILRLLDQFALFGYMGTASQAGRPVRATIAGGLGVWWGRYVVTDLERGGRMTDMQGTREGQAPTAGAERVQIERYRGMSPERKLGLVFRTYEAGRELAMAGLRQRHPQAEDEDLWRLWARQHLGDDLFDAVYGAPVK